MFGSEFRSEIFIFALTALLVGSQHISTLKLQEKQLILIKEHLAHHSEAFYHVDKVDYIEVALQLVCALSQVKLVPLIVTSLFDQRFAFVAAQAFGEREDHFLQPIVEPVLIKDQVISCIHLLSRGP